MTLVPKIYYDFKRWRQFQNQIHKDFEKQEVENTHRKIRFYNWWDRDAHVMWLHDFILKRGLLKESSKSIALCSVFGERKVLDLVNSDVRVFFSGENLHNPRHAEYAGYMLEGKKPFDLGIGFDFFEDKRYIRFPLWLMYMFAPDATENDIRERCEYLRYPEIGYREKFAALVARADWNGMRGGLADKMARYGIVSYPSDYRHNDDSLLTEYNDDKISYLKQFKFNICPENTNAMGYVTEKIFESIEAGCIPIYWGAYGNPEPDVLNPDAIMMKIDKCNIDKYDELAKLPRLKDGAEQYVIDLFDQLQAKLESLIK